MGNNDGLSAAEVWRNKVSARNLTRAVPLFLPRSDIYVGIIRPEFEAWFGSGRLPEALSRDVVLVFGKDTEEEILETLNEVGEERSAKLLEFMTRLVKAAVVGVYLQAEVKDGKLEEGPLTPIKLKDEARNPDEMALSEVPMEDQGLIIAYVAEKGVPDQPVATKSGGEVTIESLRDFPADGRGTGSGEDGRTVFHKTERVAGA